MTGTIPQGSHSVTPILVFKDARRAIEFYKRAFGAEERFAMAGPDGRGIMYAKLLIGDSVIMMGEESPNQPVKSAETTGNSPVGFYLYVKDADEAFRRAIEAGAASQMAVEDTFWGDRMGTVQDPYGYTWSIATHLKDMTAKELEESARAWFAKMAAK